MLTMPSIWRWLGRPVLYFSAGRKTGSRALTDVMGRKKLVSPEELAAKLKLLAGLGRFPSLSLIMYALTARPMEATRRRRGIRGRRKMQNSRDGQSTLKAAIFTLRGTRRRSI